MISNEAGYNQVFIIENDGPGIISTTSNSKRNYAEGTSITGAL